MLEQNVLLLVLARGRASTYSSMRLNSWKTLRSCKRNCLTLSHALLLCHLNRARSAEGIRRKLRPWQNRNSTSKFIYIPPRIQEGSQGAPASELCREHLARRGHASSVQSTEDTSEDAAQKLESKKNTFSHSRRAVCAQIFPIEKHCGRLPRRYRHVAFDIYNVPYLGWNII